MIKVKVYNQEGAVTGEETLKSEIFGVAVKQGLVQQAVEAQLANQRKVLAHTKGRGEIRGGGRKPWRQKGTGRARHGSIRSPLWKGGGITFGPTKEASFKKKINKKAKRKALLMSLSDKVENSHLIILENLKLEEAKTKKFQEILIKLIMAINQSSDKKTKNSVLIITKPKDRLVFQASKNLPRLKVISANSVNIYDILKYKYIFLTKKGLEIIYKTFSSSLKKNDRDDKSTK